MKTSSLLGCYLAFLSLAIPLSGCSLEPNSQAASSREPRYNDITKYKQLFEDCIIGNVLGGSNMENSKTSCLSSTQKSCELDLRAPKEIDQVSLAQKCLDLVSTANKKVIQNGLNVECDSGYCTITF